MEFVMQNPEFYCTDKEAGSNCYCTIQCSGCALTEENRVRRSYCCHDPRCPTSGPPYERPVDA